MVKYKGIIVGALIGTGNSILFGYLHAKYGG